jgi:glycosyltransferase involved in cell wall biosynthesis
LIASAQTVGEPWEAVVVNDASTDRTAEIGLAHSALGLLRVGIRLALGRRSALDYWYGQRPGAGSQTPNRVLAPPG